MVNMVPVFQLTNGTHYRFFISGFPLILETILGYLDDKDLRNVQQVSKHWNERVNDGNFWRTQLQQKVSSNNLSINVIHNTQPEDFSCII